MTEYTYVALARDEQTKDDIAFLVKARDTRHAEQQVRDFYHEQDWGQPLYVRSQRFRGRQTASILQVGHAYQEYQKLKEQARLLCEKLVQAADWLEGEGCTSSRDELYAFVEQFETGKQVIEAKYAPVLEG